MRIIWLKETLETQLVAEDGVREQIRAVSGYWGAAGGRIRKLPSTS